MKNVFFHMFIEIFMSFYDGQLKHQICHSFTLLISFIVFNPFQKGGPVLLDCIKFSQFFCPKAFLPKFNRPLALTSERILKKIPANHIHPTHLDSLEYLSENLKESRSQLIRIHTVFKRGCNILIRLLVQGAY